MKTYGDLDLKKIREENGLDFAHFTYLPRQCSCCYGPLDLPAKYWHSSRKPKEIRQNLGKGYASISYELNGKPFNKGEMKFILFKNACNGSGTVTRKDEIRGYTCVEYNLEPALVEKVCRDLAGQLDKDYIVVIPEDSGTTIIIRKFKELYDYEKKEYGKMRRETVASGAAIVWAPQKMRAGHN